MKKTYILNEASRSIVLEAITNKDTYFDTFSGAVGFAKESIEKRGYVIDENDWFTKINTGPGRPKPGETFRATLGLIKNGKEQKKALQIIVYNRGVERNTYELTHYIN